MKKTLLLSLFLMSMLLTEAVAQTRMITGRVTDATTGEGMPGVTVQLKGTSTAAPTDLDGTYSISVPATGGTLVFSFIGYGNREIAIGSQSTIDARLTSDARALTEVVVTGYGTQTRLEQTGAVSQVGGAEIENIPMSSVDKALQGRVPGLQSIGASGQPGSAQQIRIRGVGSITSSSAPLFVIDGVPINSGDLSRNTTTANALAGINPNDIESINVLKDASAASIYGSRAANGVIVITTKSGKAGKTSVRFDAEYGTAKRAYYNENTRMLTTAENFELFGEALKNDGYWDFYELDETTIGPFIEENFGLDPNVNTDWEDQVNRTGRSQQYNLAVSGGNEKTTFNISGGYFNQEGTTLNSEFERYSGGFNIRHSLNDKLAFGTNLLLSNSTQTGPLNSGFFANPVLAGLFLMPSLDLDAEPQGPFNPLRLAELDKNKSNILKAVGSFNAEYKILPGLSITSKYGIDFNNLEEDSYNNPFYGDAESVGGSATRYYTRYFNWVWTNLLNYTLDFNQDNTWVVNLKGGYEAQKSNFYSSNVYAENMPLNIDFTVPTNAATPITAGGANEDYSFASLLSLGDISYKGKYVLSGSFRRDGSSRFGSENRYGNFWSVGASWNVDQEEFMQNYDWINQLKLRTSYGVNGNAGIGNYDWRRVYSYASTYEGSVAATPSSLGNADLTWEKNKPFDVGVDAIFFGNRLSVTADYYTRTTSDLLLNRPLSLTTGWPSRLENIGAMKNSGFELAVTGTPVQVGDFKWDLSFNISRNKNEITELAVDKQQTGGFIRQVGKDIYQFYMPLWAGVDPEDGMPTWYIDETRSETTKTYSEAQYSLTGKSALPKAFGSVGTTFTYKGITLDGLLYYSYGNYIQDPYYQYLNSGGWYLSGFNQRATQLDRWQQEGDQASVSKLSYDNDYGFRYFSDNELNKGDFIRLRDVTLSYNIPSSLISGLKMTNLRVYARGTNLWTWVADENLPYDPESGGVTGTTNFEINVPKTITFGINVGF
ncbi:SusC/RagA family TonB-linked outer membrane protein [Rufibacter latericius]|uniref:TonB-dependent receptor n=1 Tax=Rufibacter latericius TaxID=2487040 RepID=A0A3M9MK06_9BACT|nr:TonB-dependent receptor [Rufibacter latericius]RNI25892.1 TonB-dependent receptor [Rufibacter latericius]